MRGGGDTRLGVGEAVSGMSSTTLDSLNALGLNLTLKNLLYFALCKLDLGIIIDWHTPNMKLNESHFTKQNSSSLDNVWLTKQLKISMERYLRSFVVAPLISNFHLVISRPLNWQCLSEIEDKTKTCH